MTTDDKTKVVANAASEVKKDCLATLKAAGLELVGTLMLFGAGWLFVEALFNGGSPNLLVIWLLAIPGLILDVIGGWWLFTIKFRAMGRKRAGAQNNE